MSWASKIPPELSTKNSPLVVLTGLDVKHNAIHKEIWDGFNARTNQKFRYKLLDGDHEYPKPKNKRPIEYNIPKGILKTTWFHKHLHLVPSLVVVFFELDWDELNWKEKQMECATKIELVRQSLSDRSTRLILILIQKHPNIPVDGDNGLARERYPSLCQACSIRNNYLFLLHAEHLTGYIIKLEDDAFTEPTQTYYTLEIKAIKFKRDTLVKMTHQFLFVRLAIKLAFFNEMKNDMFKAIEYYKQAYLSILDIRTYDSNIFEVKTVAGLINYKLCQLFFDIKHPIDAIDQFRKHIDIFRNKVGPPDLAFEHSAWLSKQFERMGETFEDAIKKGYLNPVQTQHPGFYYHSAANQCIQRRLYSKEITLDDCSEYAHTVENLNNLEFYGQRPWRQGQQGMDILDQKKEQNGIAALQELETKENLTPLITDLYQKALNHFKVFNCKRMKQYLCVCMAEEFYFARDYHEALNLYVNVLNDYKNEHWWPILTSIMSNALKCAFLVADITNYCLLCIELIGKNVLLTPETKSLIQENLLKVIKNEIPIHQPHEIDTRYHLLDDALSKWQLELAKISDDENEHKIIAAHASSMVPFVECKVRFSALMFNSNQHCELTVYVRTNCTEDIQFTKLYVRFNQTNYNQYCVVSSVENKESLHFEPTKIKEFRFSFLPDSKDIGKDLEVSSICLELANENASRVLVIHWKGDCKNAMAYENYTKMSFAKIRPAKPSNLGLKNLQNDRLEWNSIKNLQNTSIVTRKSNIELKLEHNMPIFVDEYYAVRLTINNLEDNPIENLVLTAKAQNINKPSNDEKYRIWIDEIDKTESNCEQIKQLENIGIKSQLSVIIFVQIKEIMSINLLIKVKYDVDVSIKKVNYNNQDSVYTFSSEEKSESLATRMVKCSCVQDDVLKLDSIYPFKFDFNILSMQMKPIEIVRTGEPFLLLCEIKNDTPYSMRFRDSCLKLPSYLKLKPNLNGNCVQTESFLKNETLKHTETATECFCLVVDTDKNQENFNSKKLFNVGEYLIEWRRRDLLSDNENEDDNDDSCVCDEEPEARSLFYIRSEVKLPEIKIEAFPFLIEANLPKYGTSDKHVTVVYKIKNKTHYSLIDIECSLDENDFFSISGNKMEFIQILPNSSADFTFVIYPLQTGYCKLPKFHVKLNNFNYKSFLIENGQSENFSGQTNEMLEEKNVSGSEGQQNVENFVYSNLDFIVQSMLPTQIFIMPQTSQVATSS